MKLQDMLTFDEGVKQKIYKDSLGYYTIGIGHLITKSASISDAIKILDARFNRNTNGVITIDEVSKLFAFDTLEALRVIQSSTLKDTYIKLDEPRRNALVNMVFQLGINGVLRFKKMIAALNEGDFIEASNQALDSNWVIQTPARANRVSSVLRTGTYCSYAM